MLVYITLREKTPMTIRRRGGFQALGLAFRHVALLEGDCGVSAEPGHQHFPLPVLGRLFALAAGIFRLGRAFRGLEARDSLYVVSLDCLAAVVAARILWRNHSRLICELHDVHPLLLRPSWLRGILRLGERFLLAHLDLLIVPSEGNLTQYYRPIARYRGNAAIVQNKLVSGEAAAPTEPRAYDGAWVLGWFCGLRCERSLNILCAAARHLGPKVKFLVAGVSYFPPGRLERAFAPLPNVTYLGPYDYAKDAAVLYAQVHIGFALHFEPEDKSKWALAVRIFEAGAYGRPVVVRAGTEMGRFISDNAIGWALEEPVEDGLAVFLETLRWDDYLAQARGVLAKDPALFSGETQLADALARLEARRT